ncbi:HdeD family acid-resistance protein [Enterovibrio paralichthyis]|uniref:HdeD family acid-resistance protein n=1 Tax=Enterovibrio paralichthyis TaxID=2853805 RepID=UPI0006D01684|nr:HdeD family acid-resistance protein [Enterovibrio paralichthyis]MBV7300796.1 HdeD family acid-resistance protein [Enterovibrio paralichthyis]
MQPTETLQKQLVGALSRNWWVLLLRGIASIIFGFLLWTLPPGESIETMVLVFGAFAFIDGALQVWTALMERKERDNWVVLLLWGVVGIAAGIMTFSVPGLTAVALLFYIAIWAVVKGVLEIITAVRLRKEIKGEWMLILGGILSILFGGFLMASPAAGAAALVWVIAMYAFVFGVLFVALSLKLKGLKADNMPS